MNIKNSPTEEIIDIADVKCLECEGRGIARTTTFKTPEGFRYETYCSYPHCPLHQGVIDTQKMDWGEVGPPSPWDGEPDVKRLEGIYD